MNVIEPAIMYMRGYNYTLLYGSLPELITIRNDDEYR
jgi:hypothetical protein